MARYVRSAMTLARIALVDDEASVRVAMGRVLRLADYEVLLYESGEEFSLRSARPGPTAPCSTCTFPG